MLQCDCPKCKDNRDNKELTVNGRSYRRCDGCKKPIPRYENMQGGGFEGHGIDHQFSYTGLGKPIDKTVRLELCYDCFKADFEKAHPGQTAPVIANVEVTLGR